MRPISGPSSMMATAAQALTGAATQYPGWSCPALGAEWERRSAASCGQTRSDAVIVAVSIALTCSDVIKQRLCWSVRSVRDEEAAGSSLADRPAWAPKRLRRIASILFSHLPGFQVTLW